MIDPRALLNRVVARVTDAPCWKCGTAWTKHPPVIGPDGAVLRRCPPEPPAETPEPPTP